MNSLRDRIVAQRWSGPLVTCTLAILIAAGVVLAGLPGLLSAIAVPSVATEGDDVFASLNAAHERQAEISSRRFLGRSPFEVPKSPGRRPVAPPPRPEPPKTEPKPEPPKVDPGPPATYTGPAPTGVAGTLVFFGPNLQIALGREDDGVRVLGILGPTEVRLGHKGGEYEVDFLRGDIEDIFTPFSADVRADVLGTSPDTDVATTSTEPWSPERGSAISMTFMDGDRRRSIRGRVQYMGRGGSGRTMVIRGEVDGRTVFQRIDESQVIDMEQAPDDSVPPLDDEVEDAPEGEIDPLVETTLRNMTTAELQSRHYQVTAVLNRPELAESMRASLEAELRLINDLLRGTDNGG